MSKNLYQASHQWATRPDDERFENVQGMHQACLAYAKSARTATVPFESLRVEADDGEIYLTGKSNRAKFSHYAFGQICKSSSSPAEFVRALPATLASQVINNRLKNVSDTMEKYDSRLLFHTDNDNMLCRAITSELYDRTWNHDIIRLGIFPMLEDGWRVPPARPALMNQKGVRKATIDDILPNQGDFGLSVKVGDDIAPAGLYASDHDMFAFLVNVDTPVSIGDRALMRGMFVRNSEVGDGCLIINWFFMDNVCGNHICWGVTDHKEIRVKHIAGEGKQDQGQTLNRALDRFEIECRKQEAAQGELEHKFSLAKKYQIAATKTETIEAVFKYAKSKGLLSLTKNVLTAGYDMCEDHKDWYGSPRSAFGLVSGITEYSQSIPYAGARHAIDAHAGKLMEIAF